MINTVIFDMDGLLLDTEPLWGISMYRVAQQHNIGITPERMRETTGLRIYEVTEHWHRRFPWQGASHEQVANEILDDIITLSIESGRIMPGVVELLINLQENGYKIGLASSSPMRMIQALIQHFGIAPYFQEVTSADSVAYGKPHPAVFLECAQKLKAAHHQCLVLEDSVNGVIAGKAARMKVVAIPDNTHINKPQFSIADKIIPSLELLTIATIEGL